MAPRVKSALFRNMTLCSLAKFYGVLVVPSEPIFISTLKKQPEVSIEMSVNF